ncbi:amidohydrolase [Clostridium thermosuccinogenes]|jgi:imidazolonepropionase-like amidohydrolase|uniref:Amidohydrolase n=1 Tax=Clostridium thermosuccinogenes TaxID=84032 RepID=A0A2K2F922_9CLOT|nr:amidohydrolase [Pseudoclostridium thermosuccinogenes]AUS98076.1 amidohydrolase [Pseudoclostridium thermosuccinogenes]PNT95258.1 amidohydrolase [Pseudoclostridium thermosuccinogenes]PNT96289.1 amidohydrolase [Pseudoclostridium thermosuccinogenes]
MLLVKNGKVLTMAGISYDNGYVLIDEGKIIKVTGDYKEIEDLLKDKENTEVIDAEGKYVLPGLIDAHCHVGMWEDAVGFEGDDGNESTDPVTPQLRAIDGVYYADRAFVEARESGVTTVVTGPGSANVIGGQFAALKTYGRRVEEMILKDPVAVKVAFGENPKTVYNEKRQTPITRMAIAAILRENLMKAREYKKQLEDYENDKENYDKPEFDIKMEVLKKVLDGEVPLKAHAHRADDILTAIRIAKEFGVKLSIEHCTEGHLITDILMEEGVSAIVGPLLTDRSKIELRNQSLKAPGILSKAGIPVAIMTDHPCVPVQHLCLCAALASREGMDEEEALKAITINAAKITGIADRVGSLEPGKDADIAIFDGHPFELRTHVVTTIINGKIVYQR